jgi:hypothetical protein
MEDSSKELVWQRLKYVHLLDCAAGSAENGDRIGIVTLGHRSEVEQPLMFSVGDCRRLVYRMLKVLEHHGDVKAEDILERHYESAAQFEEHLQLPVLPPLSYRPAVGLHSPRGVDIPNLPSLGVTMTVGSGKTQVRADALGAYEGERGLMVLYRTAGECGIARIKRGSRTCWLRQTGAWSLPIEEWERFSVLRGGRKFKIGRCLYRKLGRGALKGIGNTYRKGPSPTP